MLNERLRDRSLFSKHLAIYSFVSVVLWATAITSLISNTYHSYGPFNLYSYIFEDWSRFWPLGVTVLWGVLLFRHYWQVNEREENQLQTKARIAFCDRLLLCLISNSFVWYFMFTVIFRGSLSLDFYRVWPAWFLTLFSIITLFLAGGKAFGVDENAKKRMIEKELQKM